MENNFINYNDNWSNAGGLFGGKIKSALGIGTGAGTGLFGGKIKSALKIGDGKIFGKVTNVTKNLQYEADQRAKAQAIALAKAQADADYQASMNQIQADAIASKQALNVVEEAEAKAQAKADAEATKNAIEKGTIDINVPSVRVSSGTTDATKGSNKMLYIVGGVLVVGIIAFLLIRKNK
jgi:uncharacterized membrane protein